MENMKAQSFTETLFGPKDVSTSSPGHFGSVFGPSSMGLGKDPSHCKYTRSSKKQDYIAPKHSTDTKASYLSSSIYYGGQEAYPPTTHNFTKGGVDEDANGSSASRGNWWQGSLYY